MSSGPRAARAARRVSAPPPPGVPVPVEEPAQAPRGEAGRAGSVSAGGRCEGAEWEGGRASPHRSGPRHVLPPEEPARPRQEQQVAGPPRAEARGRSLACPPRSPALRRRRAGEGGNGGPHAPARGLPPPRGRCAAAAPRPPCSPARPALRRGSPPSASGKSPGGTRGLELRGSLSRRGPKTWRRRGPVSPARSPGLAQPVVGSRAGPVGRAAVGSGAAPPAPGPAGGQRSALSAGRGRLSSLLRGAPPAPLGNPWLAPSTRSGGGEQGPLAFPCLKAAQAAGGSCVPAGQHACAGSGHAAARCLPWRCPAQGNFSLAKASDFTSLPTPEPFTPRSLLPAGGSRGPQRGC